MQQLSLFDFGDETPKPEKKKTVSRKTGKPLKDTPAIEKEAAPIPVPEPPVEEALSTDFAVEDLEGIAATTVDISVAGEQEVVFSDEQIVVKVKQKPLQETTAPSPGSPEENVCIVEEHPAADTVAEPAAEPAAQEEDDLQNAPFTSESVEKQPAIVRKRGRKSFKEMDAEVDLIDVPPDEELFKKQYYSISIVAKWFRVNNSLLRFWENEFKILKPKKNKKGDRFFRPQDVKNLQLIYYLLRQKKLTINGAIKHLKANKENTEVNLQLIQSLNTFKSFLLELKANAEK